MTAETPTPAPAEGRQFPTTLWTHIRMARDGDSRHLEDLLVRYRTPICQFIRRKGIEPGLAEDLTQEVLLRMSKREFLARTDPSLGRFRSLLVAVTRHVISEQFRRDRAERRGGGARTLRAADIGRDSTATPFEAIKGRDDPAFDQLWVKELVEDALRRLEEDSKKRGLPLAQAFRLKYLEGLSQEDVAERLKITLFNAKNHIYYGKLKFKDLLLAAIREYCASPEEFEEELRKLSPYLKADDA
jgi:RNA polymerase sigma-70 factor (ECF subfamily)